MSAKEWFLKQLGNAHRRLPDILTYLGISNMLLGTFLAVKATPDAMEKIEDKKEEEGHDRLTITQTIQAVWKCYIWAFLAEAIGVVNITAGRMESNKREATLMLVANGAEMGMREFQAYRKYVAEKIGEKKEAEIHNQAVQTVVDRNPPPPEMTNREFIEGVAPVPICYDIQFGRYFYASYDKVLAAVNKLNQRITTGLEGYVSLNEFYLEIDVPTIGEGDKLGWSLETGLIEIPTKEALEFAGTPNKTPCWVLEFVNPPQYEFKFFRQH